MEIFQWLYQMRTKEKLYSHERGNCYHTYLNMYMKNYRLPSSHKLFYFFPGPDVHPNAKLFDATEIFHYTAPKRKTWRKLISKEIKVWFKMNCTYGNCLTSNFSPFFSLRACLLLISLNSAITTCSMKMRNKYTRLNKNSSVFVCSILRDV